MAANTVEATLRSHYSDGVSKAVESTRRTLEQNLLQMRQAGTAFGDAFGRAFQSATATLEDWRRRLNSARSESEGTFKSMGVGAAAMAISFGLATVSVIKSIGGLLVSLAREASDLTELKLAYEGLSKTVGWHADTLARLKAATEGLVGSNDLLKNANRVMQSGVKVSDSMYVEMTEHVFRLAKSARVDGAQALNTLTDALIKGNARGVQAIGIHVNVKDAISEMAMATGQHTSALQDSARMQAFYTELLQKFRDAAAKLPPDFISLEDAITRTDKALRAYFLSYGEAINRSSVLQELLKRVLDGLNGASQKREDVEALAKSVNRFLLGGMEGLAKLAEVLGWFASLWDLVWSSAKTVVNAAGAIITSVLYVLQIGCVSLLQILGKLPGQTGATFRAAAESAQYWADYFGEAARQFGNGFITSFSGIGDTQQKLDGFAVSTRVLAGDLAKFVNQVASGAAGTRQHGDAASAAAEQQKKLNDQVKKYADLQKELQSRNMSAEAKAMSDLANTLRQIESLTEISEEKKNNLRRLAYKAWLAEQLKLAREAANKEYELARETQDLIRAVSTSGAGNLKDWKTPSVLGGQQPKNLGDDLAYRNSRDMEIARRKEWEAIQGAAGANRTRNAPDTAAFDPLLKLHDQLQKLNALKMDPFHQTMSAMKGSILDFAAQGGEAFANFFADLASGQENAGKKLLAAFIGMIGQMLVRTGVLLIQTGIAEMALASTVVGRFMGASHAAGARALATGIILSAIGGTMMGVASSMAQTNEVGSSGTYQNISSPTSSTVQVINVGAAGRAQNAGEASSSSTNKVVGELVVRLDRGVIVDEVKSNIQRNGTLRTVIQNA
jgi:hypothetical protein